MKQIDSEVKLKYLCSKLTFTVTVGDNKKNKIDGVAILRKRCQSKFKVYLTPNKLNNYSFIVLFLSAYTKSHLYVT